EDMRRRTAILDTMSAFRLLSEHLGKLPGRKSLLWVTSGLPPRQLREMPDPFEKAAAALNEANVAVNVMDDDGVGDPHRRWGRESDYRRDHPQAGFAARLDARVDEAGRCAAHSRPAGRRVVGQGRRIVPGDERRRTSSGPDHRYEGIPDEPAHARTLRRRRVS